MYQEFDVATVDIDRLGNAVRRLFELEPALGGTITNHGTLRPFEQQKPPTIGVEDLRFAGPTAATARLNQVRTSMLTGRARADRPPSVRVRVSIIRDDAARIYVATDMAVADGYSILLLYIRLFELERGHDQAPPAAEATFIDALATTLSQGATTSAHCRRRRRISRIGSGGRRRSGGACTSASGSAAR